MSDVTKNVVIAFKTTGEISLKKSLQDAKTELKLIDSETKKAISSVSGFGQKSKVTALRINEATAKISIQKKRLSDLKSAYDSVVHSQGKESQEAKKIKTAMNHVETSIVSLNKRLYDLKTTGGAGFKKIREESHKTASGFSALKVGIGAAIGAFGGILLGIKNTVSYFRELKAEAQKASMSIENYQVFSKLFKKLGVDSDVLRTSMSKLTGQIRKTDEEGDEATGALSRMGIQVRDTNGAMRSSESIYVDAIRYLAGMKNETERNMLAQQLFGKSYAELNPILNQGAEGLQKSIEAIKASGSIMTPEQIDKMEQASMQMDKLSAVSTNLKNSLIAIVVPMILPFLENLCRWVSENKKNIQGWVQSIGGFLSAIAPFLPAILGLVVAFKGLMIVSAIVQGIGILVGVLKGLQIATTVMTAAQWLLNAAMTANPIGVIIMAIAALVAGIIWCYNNVEWFRNGVNSVCQAIGDFFSNLGQNISNAINWAVNGAIGFFNGLKDTVWGIISAIGQFFSNLGQTISNTITWAVNGAIGIFNYLVGFVQGVVNSIVGFFGGIGDRVSGIIRGCVNGVISFVNSVIGGINSAIGLINNIPGVSISTIGSIGYMAKGGTLVQGMSIVGEVGPELLYNTARGPKIIPLNGKDKEETIIGGASMPESITINMLDMQLVAKIKEKINEKNNVEYVLSSFSL